METETNNLCYKEHRLTVYATQERVRLKTFGHLKIV